MSTPRVMRRPRRLPTLTDDVLGRIVHAATLPPEHLTEPAGAFARGQGFARHQDFALTRVSRAFREAFWDGVDGVCLEGASGRKLAREHHWRALIRCRRLKAVCVRRNSGLNSEDLLRLWEVLSQNGRNLNVLRMDIGGKLGIKALMGAAERFGSDLQHLSLNLQPWEYKQDMVVCPDGNGRSLWWYEPWNDPFNFNPWHFWHELVGRNQRHAPVFNGAILRRLLSFCRDLRTFRVCVRRGTGRLIDDDLDILVGQARYLEDVELSGFRLLTNDGVINLIENLPHLRVLSLADCLNITSCAIIALTQSRCKSSIEAVKLMGLRRIKDFAIRCLVNSCENLKEVSLIRCGGLSSGAVSHLSCSRSLKSLTFIPGDIIVQEPGVDMNLSVIYLSCASSNLTRIRLGECQKLGVEGMRALSRLPGLWSLDLEGLDIAKPYFFNYLWLFPRLRSIRLVGCLNISDLGITCLVCIMGHRLRRLEMIDRSYCNLTDDALDAILTWGVSLCRLKLTGRFSRAAISRVRQALPQADIELHPYDYK